MERMKKEKESGTLLGVGTAFIPVHTFNKEDYVALFAFKETVKGLEKDLIELEEENRKLKEDVEFFRQCYLDLKKLCEDGGFLLPNEEIAKMFNLDEIK